MHLRPLILQTEISAALVAVLLSQSLLLAAGMQDLQEPQQLPHKHWESVLGFLDLQLSQVALALEEQARVLQVH